MKREIRFRAWNKDDNKPMFNPLIDSGLRFGTILAAPSVVIMQYTGLKDKNGKEIYEGDIVIYKEVLYGQTVKQKASIIFEDGSFCFDDYFKEPIKEYGDYIEIIGNIHENPELLK